MIIRNITIENFQSYYESQTIEFSKGLNLIIGNGGTVQCLLLGIVR